MKTTRYLPSKILIADNNVIYAEGLKHLIEENLEHCTIEFAYNGNELITNAIKNKPTLIITEVDLPFINAIDAIKIVRKTSTDIDFIALSHISDTERVLELIKEGATNYILKSSYPYEIIETIKNALRREKSHSTIVKEALKKSLSPFRFNPYKKADLIRLDEHEKTIINHLCSGLLAKEIADKMNLSSRTVEGIKHKIQEKFGVKGSVGIIVYAIKNGLVNLEQIQL